MAAGVTTVARMGGMTPEELESIPEIGPEAVQQIVLAVNLYYQALDAPSEPAVAEPVAGAPAAPEVEAAEAVTAAAESAEEVAAEGDLEAGPAVEAEEGAEMEPLTQESDTIKNSGSSASEEEPVN